LFVNFDRIFSFTLLLGFREVLKVSQVVMKGVKETQCLYGVCMNCERLNRFVLICMKDRKTVRCGFGNLDRSVAGGVQGCPSFIEGKEAKHS
jgi:hypothetical protein